MNENENLQPVQKLTPFTKMVMSIGTLPSSFYASMSYYESMVWLYEYLKNEVIPTVNNNAEAVEELQEKYIEFSGNITEEVDDFKEYINGKVDELETYMNDYFTNLDVQEEINTKLDEMATDGTLTNLIKGYVDPIYEGYEAQIDAKVEEQDAKLLTQDGQIALIDSKVDSALSGSPKGVYATVSDLTTANPDHDYIYLVSADGHWYYYNTSTTSWTDGGIYQGTALDSNEQAIFDKLQEDNGYFTGDLKPLLEMGGITITDSGWTYGASSTRVRTKEGTTIHLYPGDTFELLDSDYVMYIGYRDMKGNYYYTAWTNAKQTVVFEADYVLLIRTNPEGAITVDDVKSILKVTSFNQLNYLRNNIETDGNFRTDVDYFRRQFTNAGLVINHPHGFGPETTRFSLTAGITLDYDLIVEVPDGYSVAFQEWTGSVGGSDHFVRDTKWLGKIAKIPKNRLITISIKKDDNGAITSSFRENIKFYRPEELYNKFDLTHTSINSINHRGYNSLAPEETAPAYKLSKEHGFDIVECDIRLTSDGHVVLLHDATIDRTSNGTGNVADKTLAELKALDFGSWFSPEYAGTQILTLEEFLRLCRDINLSCYIEIEPDAGFTFSKLQEVAQIVDNYHMTSKVTYISFGFDVLNWMSIINPRARLGLNINNSSIYYQNMAQITMLNGDYNYVFLNCAYTAIDSTLIELCKDNNLYLECWTPYTTTEIINMDPYVNGFTTDVLVAEKVLYDNIMNN